MVCAIVATNILALIEIVIMHVFLHALTSHMDLANHDASSTSLIVIARNIGISHILCVNASTTVDHWQLL